MTLSEAEFFVPVLKKSFYIPKKLRTDYVLSHNTLIALLERSAYNEHQKIHNENRRRNRKKIKSYKR
jgi:hypothetical protein